MNEIFICKLVVHKNNIKQLYIYIYIWGENKFIILVIYKGTQL
jgi:hypothetical protein